MHSSRSAAPPGLCPLQTTPLKVLGLLGTSRPWAAAGSTPAFRLGFEVVARSGTRPPPVTSWSLLLNFCRHLSRFSPFPFLTAGTSDLLPHASYPLAAISSFPTTVLPPATLLHRPLNCLSPSTALSSRPPTASPPVTSQHSLSIPCLPQHSVFSPLGQVALARGRPRAALADRGRCPWLRRLLGVHRAHVPPSQLTFRVACLLRSPC